MRGVNKVIIVGTLGQDVDLKEFPNGGKLANFSVATNESWTDKQSGERKESTEWHRIVVNNRLAEIAKQYLKKGSRVYVEGSLRTRQWTDQNGQERYTTEIRAENLQMLDSQNQGGNGGNGNYGNQGGNGNYGNQGGNGGGYGNQGGNGNYGNQGGNGGGYGNQGGNGGGYGNQGGNGGGYSNQGGNRPNNNGGSKNPNRNQQDTTLDDDLPF